LVNNILIKIDAEKLKNGDS